MDNKFLNRLWVYYIISALKLAKNLYFCLWEKIFCLLDINTSRDQHWQNHTVMSLRLFAIAQAAALSHQRKSKQRTLTRRFCVPTSKTVTWHFAGSLETWCDYHSFKTAMFATDDWEKNKGCKTDDKPLPFSTLNLLVAILKHWCNDDLFSFTESVLVLIWVVFLSP